MLEIGENISGRSVCQSKELSSIYLIHTKNIFIPKALKNVKDV